MSGLFNRVYREVRETVEAHAEFPEAFQRWAALERLRHPDRVLHFTVRWVDDDGAIRQTPAWRVQHSNALGPYKGGLRFHPRVDEDTLRFLAFEQCLKNALTGLPLGGGKGGAAIDPSEHSAFAMMRFCQAFMDEYVRYCGGAVDVPAGDIGTGEREIGWLFGRYAKLTGRIEGTLTGKPEALGGIPGRTEATGYGAVCFAEHMCREHDFALDGARIAISGAGNVALHAARRATARGARVVSLSNSSGALTCDRGLSSAQLDAIASAQSEGQRLEDIAGDLGGCELAEGKKPWHRPADIAMPCATENELGEQDARMLIDNGVRLIVEGANMPLTADAHQIFLEHSVSVGVGKAANAGGVAVSGFEMTQNATKEPWSREAVLDGLFEVMGKIHERCLRFGRDEHGGPVRYDRGANLAGYERIAHAIVAAGIN